MENIDKLLQAIRDGKMQSFTVEDTSMRPTSSGRGLVDRVTEAVYNAANNADKIKQVKDNVREVLGNDNSLVDRITSAVDKAAGKAIDQIDEKEDETEEVQYTYKPGDTFGQVLLNLGLSDADNLWGGDNNVDYYTQQLRDQGVWGNIPVGSTITLRKRK